MATLYLKEQEVEELVTVPEVIDILDTAFRDQAAGRGLDKSSQSSFACPEPLFI
jgi:ornithine cyclodeaminase/alanine dehydrogenase-like protein (mu-crystallin family)